MKITAEIRDVQGTGPRDTRLRIVVDDVVQEFWLSEKWARAFIDELDRLNAVDEIRDYAS